MKKIATIILLYLTLIAAGTVFADEYEYYYFAIDSKINSPSDLTIKNTI